MKIALAFSTGAVGVLLGIPIVRYVLSPMRRDYDRWIPLGTLDQFPAGETRLATFRNPVSNHSDGDTAELPCWVRNVNGLKFRSSQSMAHLELSRAMVSAVAFIYVPVPAVRITKTAHAHQARPSEACSNIRSRFSMGHFTFRRENCPPPGPSCTVRPSQIEVTAMRLMRRIGDWLDGRLLQLGTPIRETIDRDSAWKPRAGFTYSAAR